MVTPASKSHSARSREHPWSIVLANWHHRRFTPCWLTRFFASQGVDSTFLVRLVVFPLLDTPLLVLGRLSWALSCSPKVRAGVVAASLFSMLGLYIADRRSGSARPFLEQQQGPTPRLRKPSTKRNREGVCSIVST